MPRIPVYNTQQVDLQGIAAPQVGSLPNNGLAELGRGIANVGASIQKFQNEADTIRAEEAFNKLREKQNALAYGEGGAFTVKGGNVFNRDKPFVDDYVGRLDSEAEAIAATLANDNQKDKFMRAAGRAKVEFGGQVQRHEAQEGVAYREGVFKGVLASEQEHVAQNFMDADSVEQSIQRVTANTRSFAMTQGLSADQQDMAVKEAVSGLHMLVIERKLDGDQNKGVQPDPVGAKQYYQDQVKAGNILEGSKQAKTMRDKIEADERSFRASNAVDAVWKGFGPDDDTEAVNLDVMAAELRTEFKNDPNGLKIAMAELKDRASTHDYSVRQRESQITGGIWNNVLGGMSLNEIKRSPEFRALDGQRQADMVSKIESFQKRGQEGDDITKFAKYWAYASNPQALAKMSDAEIFALTPQIGAGQVKQLLSNKQQLLKGDDKVMSANIDQEQFNYWATQGGLDTGSKKDADKNALGELKFRVETMIDDEQRRLGRQLQRKEKDDIMKRLIVEVPVRVQNRVFSGTSVEPRRLYEVKDPNNIVIQGADRDAVVKALQSVGIKNPTDAQIREGYVRLKAQ
jgi:hypothetical protein